MLRMRLSSIPDRYVSLACGALLAVLTVAVYWQAGRHEFISLDDYEFIAGNPHVSSGLSRENLTWAFAPVRGRGWFPLTWLSHMTDVELYGMNPRGHHLTNVFFHAAAALLLFNLLLRMTGAVGKSLLVAFLFALHPLHVESVAWLAERRDVLSAFFGFLSLSLYVKYVLTRKRRFYLSALGAFTLGLMAKPMLVTLPLVMLLLDYWPLNRFRIKEQLPGEKSSSAMRPLLKEKLPFLVPALLCAAITLLLTPAKGAGPAAQAIPFGLRLANAPVAFVKYLVMTFSPANLAIYYPFPASIPVWQVSGALLLLGLITLAVIRFRVRQPYLFVGWFWFLIMLVPVSGVVQFASHAMADRYTYLPLTGLFLCLAWGLPQATQALPWQKPLLAILATVGCLLAAVLTWQQLRYWQDDITLYRHTLQVTTGNARIHKNLGLAFAVRGRLDEAVEQFRNVLAIDANDLDARYNLGLALADKGEPQLAIGEFRTVIRLNPRDFDAYLRMGMALSAAGDVRGGISAYNKALEINPASDEARTLLKAALARRADLSTTPP